MPYLCAWQDVSCGFVATPDEINILTSRQEFKAHVSSLIKKQLEPPKKADAEFSFLVNEVGGALYLPVTRGPCQTVSQSKYDHATVSPRIRLPLVLGRALTSSMLEVISYQGAPIRRVGMG